MQIQMYHKNLCSQVSKLQNFVKRYLKWTLGPTEALSGWRKCLFAICLSDPMLSSAIYLSIYRSVDQVNGRSWRWPNFLWDQQIKLSKSSSSSSGHASILARTPPIDLFLSFAQTFYQPTCPISLTTAYAVILLNRLIWTGMPISILSNCFVSLIKYIKCFIWVVVVVNCSACLPSIPMIRVRIPLKFTFLVKFLLLRTKINKKRLWLVHF